MWEWDFYFNVGYFSGINLCFSHKMILLRNSKYVCALQYIICGVTCICNQSINQSIYFNLHHYTL